MTMTGCPELRRLASLLNNRVLAAEGTELEDHVESCGDCQQALDALTDAIDWGLGPSHGGSMAMQEMEAAAAGDGQSAAQLLPLVYAELRKLAAARMAEELPGHTLNPPPWSTRPTCGWSATDSAAGGTSSPPRPRRCGASWSTMPGTGTAKRGGGRVRLELLDQPIPSPKTPTSSCRWTSCSLRLGQEDAPAAQVAHLHLFGGLSVEKAGEALGISRAVAYRNWKYARAWLRRPGNNSESRETNFPWMGH